MSYPDTGETFYIGKGKGNRVFSHANGNLESDSNIEKIEGVIIRNDYKIHVVKHIEKDKERKRINVNDATTFDEYIEWAKQFEEEALVQYEEYC